MLKLIIEMLEFQKLGTSEAVDIAKGKYKIPNNLKEFKNQVKWQLQRQ
jgi:transcriptional regulator with AAA-type ATPase domain